MKAISLMSLSTLLTLTVSLPSQAKVWQNEYGVTVSDTCVTRSGIYFVFTNQVRPVGTPCTFYLQGDPTIYRGFFG